VGTKATGTATGGYTARLSTNSADLERWAQSRRGCLGVHHVDVVLREACEPQLLVPPHPESNRIHRKAMEAFPKSCGRCDPIRFAGKYFRTCARTHQPSDGMMSPVSSLSIVLLPAPLGPTTATLPQWPRPCNVSTVSAVPSGTED